MTESVGIIGLGRFGQALASLLQADFSIVGFDTQPVDAPDFIHSTTLKNVLSQKTIFIAVPIRYFESVIQEIAPHIKPNTTLLDVCSVKVHPVNVMEKYLPKHCNVIATHPMFGPDSIDANNPLNMMMHAVRDAKNIYGNWKNYFSRKSIEIIELTPDEHDQQAAMSQGVTHFIGRVIEEAGFKPTQIDTLGFTRLLQVAEQTCQDSWELFCDLQNYNPYSTGMIEQLDDALKKVHQKLG